MISFNNKTEGSTLALVIIVFAVLMIFGTFILGFTVTENKMSINHQHKAQAYYLARSGAVAVEAAIMDLYNKDDKDDAVNFFNSLNVHGEKLLEPIMVDNNKVDLSLYMEPIAGDDDNFLLNIRAKSFFANTNQVVEKVLNIPKPIIKGSVELEAPIVYVNEINEQIEKLKTYRGDDFARKGNPANYKLPEFEPEEFPEDSKDAIPSYGQLSGNYYVETLNGDILKDREINGKVNIYVKNSFTLDAQNSLKINANGDEKNLNIIVYSGEVNLRGTNGKKVTMKSNLSVKSGEVNLNFHKLEYHGNIMLGEGVNININVEDNGNDEHVNIKGIIYGPGSIINLGDDKKGALSVRGGIIGYDVNYHYKVNNANQSKIFRVDKDTGIGNPIEFEETVITSINAGYFK